MNRITNLFGMFLDILYPRRCPVCDRAVAPCGHLICKECEPKIVYIKEPYCMKCGKQLADEQKEYCADCMEKVHKFDAGRALFDYKSIAKSLYRFKYGGRREYARYYAQGIAGQYGAFLKQHNVQAIVPVPIHKKRFQKRGYNQAEELAKEVGKLTNLPVLKDWIVREKETLPMKDLSAAERQNNLKKALKIRRNDVKLDTIVIMDDIYTTGSTVDAVSEKLRETGVEKIYVISLAIGRGI